MCDNVGTGEATGDFTLLLVLLPVLVRFNVKPPLVRVPPKKVAAMFAVVSKAWSLAEDLEANTAADKLAPLPTVNGEEEEEEENEEQEEEELRVSTEEDDMLDKVRGNATVFSFGELQ